MTYGRLSGALGGALLAGCLRVEPWPQAGSLIVELESVGQGASPAFVTGDGWTVTMETASLSVGEVGLVGACSQYSESSYLRVLDLRRPEVQRVNVSYALGECEMHFSVFTPAYDAVIGPGIEERTVSFMRKPASDPFVDDRGVTFLVAGRAEKDGSTVRFSWPFRQAFEFGCPSVNLEAGTVRTVRLEARVPALFQLDGDDGTSRFEAVAECDADADGQITLEELAAAPAIDGTAPSLGAQLYFTAVPNVLALQDGAHCDAHRVEPGRREH